MRTRMGLREWLWSLLPDKCQMPKCGRHGVRGNENRIFVSDEEYWVMCDYCHVRWSRIVERMTER